MSRREAHLRELADQLGAEITLTRTPHPDLGFSDYEEPYGTSYMNRYAEVWRWDGRSSAAYFAGLHELGHIAHRHHTDFDRDDRQRILEAEAEAWDWAFAHAAEKPSARVLALAKSALESYIRDYGTRTAGSTYRGVASRVGLEAA